MEREKGVNDTETRRLNELADELDALQRQKHGEQGDRSMQKLIALLRAGDIYAAKLLCGNEADKFTEYRGDGVLLIIDKLYGGSGSPWFTIERRRGQQARKKGESSQ